MLDNEVFQTTPTEENCVEISVRNAKTLQILEGSILMFQLIEKIGLPPKGADFKLGYMQGFTGISVTLEFQFDLDYKDHIDYLECIKSNFPSHWSKKSKKILKDNGYYSFLEKHKPVNLKRKTRLSVSK